MLLDSFRTKVAYAPYFNTGTIFDYATGTYQLGKGGDWYLNGGLNLLLGIAGRGQTYKSALAGSLMANTLYNHPMKNGLGIEAYVYESEFTIPDQTRYDDFVPEQVSHRIMFDNKSTMDLAEWYERIKAVGEAKVKNRKDFMVESPFIDPYTGKPHRVWIPTICLMDSWSMASSAKENEIMEGKEKVDSTSMNTIFMQDGLVKTRILRTLPQLAAKYGIYFIMTAHIGNKIDMDMYNKSPKQLQYMGGQDKLKQVGSNFTFLTTMLMQTTKVEPLISKGSVKESMYPSGSRSSLTEVNLVNTTTVRCKNNMSGLVTPYVVSQHQGILNDVTYFHLLKGNGDFGMTAKTGNYTTYIGDKSLTRKNVRTHGDYETSRALELLGQICYMQKYWSPHGMADYVYRPVEEIRDQLLANSTLSSDILNSTGNWTLFKGDRKYMSTMSILERLSKDKVTK